jgi:hypothetical protein
MKEKKWQSISVAGTLRMVINIVCVESCPYPNNNGKSFKHLEKESGHPLIYVKKKRLTLRIWKWVESPEQI